MCTNNTNVKTECDKFWRRAEELLDYKFLQILDHVSFTFIFSAPSTSALNDKW